MKKESQLMNIGIFVTALPAHITNDIDEECPRHQSVIT